MIIANIYGGLGNQLFMFAMSRMLQKKYKQPALWEISGLKLTNTVFDLDKFDIDMSDVSVTDDRPAIKRKYWGHLGLAGCTSRMLGRIERLFSRRIRIQIERRIQRSLNFFGIYLVLQVMTKFS